MNLIYYKLDLIKRTPRGRIATAEAYRHLNIEQDLDSFEKIGLIVLFFISLIYSYVKPTAIVENIQTKQNIVIYVEGEFEKKLSFKTKPTINDVLTKLQTDNHYQFNENYQLTNESKLYLPHGQNLFH